jgi:hypothetical protein
VLLHRVLKRVPITITQAVTTDTSIKRDARAPGVDGTCAGKSAAIPARHTIWRDRGPAMGRTPADRPSARSSSGDITLEKSSARKTVNGSFRAATTGMRCEPGRGRLPTPSRFDAHRPFGALRPKHEPQRLPSDLIRGRAPVFRNDHARTTPGIVLESDIFDDDIQLPLRLPLIGGRTACRADKRTRLLPCRTVCAYCFGNL